MFVECLEPVGIAQKRFMYIRKCHKIYSILSYFWMNLLFLLKFVQLWLENVEMGHICPVISLYIYVTQHDQNEADFSS